MSSLKPLSGTFEKPINERESIPVNNPVTGEMIETVPCMTEADIDTDAPLFGEGLGLDSIDALELIVLMEKEYGIKLNSAAESKEILRSVRTMAEYISKNRKK